MLRFSFPSANGTTLLAAYRTQTDAPQALVQISHGMCEYFLRYEGFAEYLSENRFLVFGHDHVGHGHSASVPEDLGFIPGENGADDLAEDVHQLACLLKKEYPDLPIILLGHSMGSFVARSVLEKYPDTYASAIIMGTAGSDMPTGLGKLLASLIIAFCGERHRSNLLRGISFAGYNKRYEKGCPENAWLTRDTAVVERYDRDPLCNFVFTARAYRVLFTLLGNVSRKEWAQKISKDKPLLLVSGADDPVGGWGKGVEKIYLRLQNAGLSHVSLSLYPEMRHEILNELSCQTVWSDLLTWMQESIKSQN